MAAKRSRVVLVAAFAVVVGGLAAVDALVLLTVEPQLQALHDIANEHARAVQLTTSIDARISSARRDLLTAVGRAEGGTPAVVEVSRELARVQHDMDELALLRVISRAEVESLRALLARCAEECRRIEAVMALGDPQGARRQLERFAQLTHAANAEAGRIVASDAEEIEEHSRSIHRALRWTVVAVTAVTILGGASALLLLRRALRGLAGEEAASAARSADLEAFAARAAHELRTPLQTVSLSLGALDRQGSPRAMERARRAAERLQKTVDGLLEFARAGVPARAPGAAELARVVSDVQEELGTQLASARASIQVEVPPGTVLAMTDSHLATVMRNLLGNAVKYAGSRPGARIQVRAARQNARCRVEVIDDGPGIPADALPKVFDPFVRATATSSGHGLGLATVKRLVEAHGGEVRISSEPGRGTTVALELPCAAARETR